MGNVFPPFVVRTVVSMMGVVLVGRVVQPGLLRASGNGERKSQKTY